MPHKNIPNYPSVTQILDVINKPWLLNWYAKNGLEKCQKIKKTSQSFGTRVHTEIERLLTGLEPRSKNLRIRTMVSNFNEQFIKPYQVKPVVIEPKEPLIDEGYKYSGTFDAIVKIQESEKLVIVDWKTSNSVDDISWPLQLSAYARLWNSQQVYDKNLINEGFIIRLDKKTLAIEGPLWYADLDHYFEVFLSCRRLYDYVNKKGLWNKND